MQTALVTGGNKGIGLAACRGLAEKGFRVFLASRDAKRGQAACDTLHKEGFKQVELIVLDVSDEKSIAVAAQKLSTLTDHLDVLVNNAGVYLDDSKDEARRKLEITGRDELETFTKGMSVSSKTIFDTFTINTLGPLLLTRALAPLLAKSNHAQVINVSSGMGQLSDMNGGCAAYRISKTGLNAVTRILAAELAERHIHVNSICPGWVKTDMGGAGATRTVEQGADTIIWLATAGGHHSGGFYRDRNIIPW